MIPPSRGDLEAEGMEVIEERGPTLLIEGRTLITGQIPRITPFEKGFPPSHAEINGQWQPDPWIHDDQAVVVHVRGKGLVVLTGCGHAGLINTLHHAQEATGIREIYAVIGGFHLTGSLFEPIIPPTIQALKEFSPKVIVPQHCTGFRATFEIAREFPDAFVPTSVGTKFIL
jgi:7,8-dihydropterin-6-yl-methyl-4-(beta-D-ribofuranosyl)aminobenzene 5'-phosphate synthase